MAVFDIGFTEIAANGTTSWFIHGWGPKDAVTYSIVVFPGTGVTNPIGRATLTQGESLKWSVDGSFAHVVYIRNLAPFNSADVHLIATMERLP